MFLCLNKMDHYWCIVVTEHNRAGAESFLHNRFVHNRAGAESFLQNRFVHNRAGAQSFLHNWFVHNRAGAESWRIQSIRCPIILVHNRSVPDRSCWIDTVKNRAVLDRYHPDVARWNMSVYLNFLKNFNDFFNDWPARARFIFNIEISGTKTRKPILTLAFT